jgi:hypothetical protein
VCRKSVEESERVSIWQSSFLRRRKGAPRSLPILLQLRGNGSVFVRSGLLPLKMIAYLPLLRHQNIPSRISIHPAASRAAKLLLFNRSAETIPTTSWSFYSPHAQNSRRITLRGRSVGVSGARCPFWRPLFAALVRPMEKMCTLNWWEGGVLQVVGLA